VDCINRENAILHHFPISHFSRLSARSRFLLVVSRYLAGRRLAINATFAFGLGHVRDDIEEADLQWGQGRWLLPESPEDVLWGSTSGMTMDFSVHILERRSPGIGA
jgi:hypothetical protein